MNHLPHLKRFLRRLAASSDFLHTLPHTANGTIIIHIQEVNCVYLRKIEWDCSREKKGWKWNEAATECQCGMDALGRCLHKKQIIKPYAKHMTHLCTHKQQNTRCNGHAIKIADILLSTTVIPYASSLSSGATLKPNEYTSHRECKRKTLKIRATRKRY